MRKVNMTKSILAMVIITTTTLLACGGNAPAPNTVTQPASFPTANVTAAATPAPNPSGSPITPPAAQDSELPVGELRLVKVEIPGTFKAGETVSLKTPFMANGSMEIPTFYVVVDTAAPFVVNWSNVRFAAAKTSPGSVGINFVWNVAGSHTIRCYLDYKLPDGNVKRSNEVTTVVSLN